MGNLMRCSVEGPSRRGRPLGRWVDRVKEYLSERGEKENDLEWVRRECMDRERWRQRYHLYDIYFKTQSHISLRTVALARPLA